MRYIINRKNALLKRVLLFLFFACVFLPFSVISSYASDLIVAEDDAFDESDEMTESADEFLPDTDTLFEGYVNSQFYPEGASGDPTLAGSESQKGSYRKAQRITQGSKLDGLDRNLYNALLEKIVSVAGGTLDDTNFKLSLDDIGVTKDYYSAADLGVESIVYVDDDGKKKISPEASSALNALFFTVDVKKVVRAISSDHPYELYWFDKVTGYSYPKSLRCTAKYDNDLGEYVLAFVDNADLYPASFKFYVSEDYKLSSSEPLLTDTAKTSATVNAVANAQEIVEGCAYLDDYEKLVTFRDEICSLVSYNKYAATESNNVPYGDPWQLIWVFDRDDSTNVVCEGYSKAMKFLCDMSDFKGDISCILVTGRTSDLHMWNIISIENANYLVDVTNSDTGNIGSNGQLFLAGSEDEDTSSSYTIQTSATRSITYTYDTDTMTYFSDAERSISHERYVYDNCDAHELDYIDEVPADCQNEGTKGHYICSKCGKMFLDADALQRVSSYNDLSIPVIPHDPVVVPAVAATCEQNGLTEGIVCDRCGSVIVAQNEIPKKGHSWGEWVTVTEATYKQEGLRRRVCSNDSSHIDEEVIPVLEDPNNGQGGTGNNNSGSGDSNGGSGNNISGTEDSNGGSGTGNTDNNDTNSGGDNNGSGTQGSASGHVHNITKINSSPASCNKDGNTVYYSCSLCGKIFSDKSGKNEISLSDTVIPATGHAWDKGTVTKEATATSVGKRLYTCLNNSSHTRTRKIPKLKVSGLTPAKDAPALADKEKTVLKDKTDEDIKGSSYSVLAFSASKVGKKSVRLTWTPLDSAKGYVIYGAKCGNAYKKLKTIKKNTTKAFTVKKIGKAALKPGKSYKFFIAAYASYQGEKRQIAASKTIHVMTKGGKYSNYTGIDLKNVKEDQITLKLKTKKTFSIKAASVKASDAKVKVHRKLCYESTNPNVVKVSAKGKVTAKGKGSCFIYVFTQNGLSRKISVTVK